jgi:tRNA(Ile)-lysidine synthase
MDFSPALLAGHLAPLLPRPRPRLAIALSGGADSAALLHALAELRGADPELVLRALHVNHGLTPAAAELERAASAGARLAGVELAVLAITVDDAADEGLEAAARRARYAALGAALAPGECLLTAHHLEDQAETLLLQLLRGTGIRGLGAMPAASVLGHGRLLRPLLGVPRAALRAYAAGARLYWVEDPMNADPRFERAFLRARLWPAISERWPQAASALARTAAHAAAAQQLLDGGSALALAALRRGPALAIEGLLALSPATRAESLRYWLRERGVAPPSTQRLALIERELLRARGTGQPCMRWRGVELRTFAGFLYAFAPLARAELAGRPLPGAGGAIELGALGRVELAAGGAGGLRLAGTEHLRLAHRDGGERIRLAPGARRRALKDLLREAHLPPWARERAVLVVGDALAAVVLPHATWIAAEYTAGAGQAALALAWRDAPEVLMPAPP